MADISALRSNTTTAATAAHSAKLISDQQFKNMTDGTVSMADVKIARDLAGRHTDGDKGAIARALNEAVSTQNRAQGAETISETVKDLF